MLWWRVPAAPRAPRPRRRGRRPLADADRKDRLVQTRIPEALDDALREAAKRERVTVSQLVRGMLENTFEVVEGAVALGRNIGRSAAALGEQVARDARAIGRAARGDDSGDAVYAWQEVVCNRAATCSACGRALAKGERAWLGLSDVPVRTPRWSCARCAATLERPRRTRT
jgi:hypothetical protein